MHSTKHSELDVAMNSNPFAAHVYTYGIFINHAQSKIIIEWSNIIINQHTSHPVYVWCVSLFDLVIDLAPLFGNTWSAEVASFDLSGILGFGPQDLLELHGIFPAVTGDFPAMFR